MSRSSSVPNARTYSKDYDNLPRITRNSWWSKGSKNSEENDKLRDKRYLSRKYVIGNKNLNNSINNLVNNSNEKLKGKNPAIYEQINEISNNYKEMKNILKNKINKLEQNQKRINNILKYSFAKRKLNNNLNTLKFNKNINNSGGKIVSEKEYLLNMLNKIPNNFENKMGQIYLDEVVENRNQKNFLDIVKNILNIQFQNKRRIDYLKFKRQLNELIKLKNKEEMERAALHHKIEEQEILSKIQEIKYKNQLYRYQALNNYNFPYQQLMQENLKNLNTNKKDDSLGLSIEELIKLLLFKQITGNSEINDYLNMMDNYLFNIIMKANSNFSFNNFYGPLHRRFNSQSRNPQKNFDTDLHLKRDKYSSYHKYDSKNRNNEKTKTFDKKKILKELELKKEILDKIKAFKQKQNQKNINLDKKSDNKNKANKEEPKKEENNDGINENKDNKSGEQNKEESESDDDNEEDEDDEEDDGDNDDDEDDNEGDEDED